MRWVRRSTKHKRKNPTISISNFQLYSRCHTWNRPEYGHRKWRIHTVLLLTFRGHSRWLYFIFLSYSFHCLRTTNSFVRISLVLWRDDSDKTLRRTTYRSWARERKERAGYRNKRNIVIWTEIMPRSTLAQTHSPSALKISEFSSTIESTWFFGIAPHKCDVCSRLRENFF